MKYDVAVLALLAVFFWYAMELKENRKWQRRLDEMNRRAALRKSNPENYRPGPLR